MKKKNQVVLTLQDQELFNSIEGFTKKFDDALKERKKTEAHIGAKNVVNMPTYEFATLALQSDSPFQVIKVIEQMKTRYALRPNFEKEAMGFLDSIQGKAYGYIAYRITNLEDKLKLFTLAKKCFNRAISRGYHDAIGDLSDLNNKFVSRHEAHELLRNPKLKTSETNTQIGAIYYGFTSLVHNVIRVLEDRRPLIDNIENFKIAGLFYEWGSEKSINSEILSLLLQIIESDLESDRKQLIALLESKFDKFKEKNKNVDKLLFASDAKIFNENIELIERKILNRKVR